MMTATVTADATWKEVLQWRENRRQAWVNRIPPYHRRIVKAYLRRALLSSGDYNPNKAAWIYRRYPVAISIYLEEVVNGRW